jgi:predicted alpha-1,2-mannosidase
MLNAGSATQGIFMIKQIITRNVRIAFLLPLLLASSFCFHSAAAGQPGPDLASFVNPFVGTDKGGNTFPGADSPFGMMQLSPNWGNNGYYYPQTKMHGFVLNLMSGNGGENEGQVLFTATTGPVKIDRASTDYNFDHQHESASAGYYQVQMQPTGINAQLTTLTRAGMARFTFPSSVQSNIVLPLSYANTPVTSSSVHMIDSHTIAGQVSSFAFQHAKTAITVYFVMSFSKPFSNYGTWSGTTMTDGSSSAAQTSATDPVIGFYGSYPASVKPRTVDVRIGMSYVDEQGAINNLKTEIPDGTKFDKVKAESAQAWDKELSLIDVEGGTITHNRVFYTAMYHAMLAPMIGDDEDGRYMGYDEQIHNVDTGHAHFYETFSGWDIYRTEIPLMSIIEPVRTQDMAQSIVDMAKQLGYIDRWPQLNAATGCMNGDPLTVVLANIWSAGLHNFDIATAYQYMWKETLAGDPHSHINVYQKLTEEQSGVTLNDDVSVSSALEYDESFAALGHLAEELGKSDDANYLYGRAFQYRDMFNVETGFLQARSADGAWDPTFPGYTEGNKWIYLWFVPEDVQGLVDLVGGTTTFDSRLDEFFDNKYYDPTNEPDLQAAFLYDYIDRPWKSQHVVAETADQCYSDSPGGLAGGGNDDLGTMSSWYILSQLGFYFVDPGIPYVEVCTPRFPKAILHLSSPNGTKSSTFEIDAPAATPTAEYIQSATLNGVALNSPWFSETQITGGGTWYVVVGDQPNQTWAASPSQRPYSLSCGWGSIPPNASLTTVVPDGRTGAYDWKYTTDQPADNWYATSFDDSTWQTGQGAFGSGHQDFTPRTNWDTPQIWLRRTITLPANVQSPAIDLFHDQDADVFLNGVFVKHLSGWSNGYEPVGIPPAALQTLHAGQNILALHVVRLGDWGAHFADAGIATVVWPDDNK